MFEVFLWKHDIVVLFYHIISYDLSYYVIN